MHHDYPDIDNVSQENQEKQQKVNITFNAHFASFENFCLQF
jgi:hypothetical protein